jgi:hypothetical protein
VVDKQTRLKWICKNSIFTVSTSKNLYQPPFKKCKK